MVSSCLIHSPCVFPDQVLFISHQWLGGQSSRSQRTAAVCATPSTETLHGQVLAGGGGPHTDVSFLSQRHQLWAGAAFLLRWGWGCFDVSSSDMSWVALSNAGCRWLPFPGLVCYPADHSQNWWSERRCNEIRCGLGSSEYSCLCRSLRRLRVNSRHVCLSNLPQHVPTCPQHIFCRRLFKSAALMRKDTKGVFHDAILLYWFTLCNHSFRWLTG